jgi:hypothetical protein
MTLDQFKDRLFDVLNDCDCLPIEDIEINDKEDFMEIVMNDRSKFFLKIKEE